MGRMNFWLTSDEFERQRRILENQALLSSLGIERSITLPNPTPKAGPSKRPRSSKPMIDRSGHILSLPRPGEVHHLACVEIRPVRSLSKRIHSEYQDCGDWAIGESRRWRFGKGRGGKLRDSDEAEVGGVGESFRWRRWKGLKRELRSELPAREKVVAKDSRPERIPYSVCVLCDLVC